MELINLKLTREEYLALGFGLQERIRERRNALKILSEHNSESSETIMSIVNLIVQLEQLEQKIQKQQLESINPFSKD